MNIAGYMAALEIDDLDHMAKMAVQKVAGRADRYTGAVTVGTGRLAADMGVHYDTAWRALTRAVRAGYLTVDKHPGLSPTWQLTPRVTRGVTPRGDAVDPPRSAGGVRGLRGDYGLLEKIKESSARHPAGGRAGENPGATVYSHYPDWTGAHAARIARENGSST